MAIFIEDTFTNAAAADLSAYSAEAGGMWLKRDAPGASSGCLTLSLIGTGPHNEGAAALTTCEHCGQASRGDGYEYAEYEYEPERWRWWHLDCAIKAGLVNSVPGKDGASEGQ